VKPPASGYEAPMRVARRRALAVGFACGLVFAFVFSLRAGAVIGPAIALLLWRGPKTRTLVIAAGALLGLVAPVLYLVVPVDDMGGFNSDYANDLIAAHWVAVAAWMLLALALYRSLAELRRNRRSTAARKGP
jgi:arabinofuranan 3-O-arabinosyltransferase